MIIKEKGILAHCVFVQYIPLGSRAVSADPDSPPTVLQRQAIGVCFPTWENTAAYKVYIYFFKICTL